MQIIRRVLALSLVFVPHLQDWPYYICYLSAGLCLASAGKTGYPGVGPHEKDRVDIIHYRFSTRALAHTSSTPQPSYDLQTTDHAFVVRVLSIICRR